MKQFEAVIGLEVHAQLATNSKVFATSATTAGCEPNTLTDPVTLGLPGVLPVLNRRAIDFAIKLGLALESEIADESIFARKHYHYPDLPKGYQISQYDKPICIGGGVTILSGDKERRIGITRIHLEEDAGKNVHLENDTASIIDLNRAGVPLLEIVSEPDIRTPAEAGAYMRSIRQMVRYLGICDGNMEEGSLRCDANVSLREPNAVFGTKVEIKNLNSFRHVEKALEYEIDRQASLLIRGEAIIQETRLWDETRGVTRSMRSKEHAQDYRYFPDPDLLPVVVNQDWIDKVKATIPELPDPVFHRFASVYKLERQVAMILSEERLIAKYYDDAIAEHNNPTLIANWITTELFGRLNRENLAIVDCPVSPQNLAQLIKLIDDQVISGKIAKSVFEEMFITGASPHSIVEAQGLRQITDFDHLRAIIDRVLELHPEQVLDYQNGKTKMLGFFVGQVMTETGGKANPKMVNQLLETALNSGKN